MPDGVKPLLLDTHCWIWMESGETERFSKTGLRAIDAAVAASGLLLSVISVWELGMLEFKGRVKLTMPCAEWVRRSLQTPRLSLAPLSLDIALDSTRLPGGFHGDPADRIIVATSRALGARLLTKDKRIVGYGATGHANVIPA